MGLGAVLWVLTASVVYLFAARPWWFPPPISNHAQAYDTQFLRTLLVAGIIFVLAHAALGFAIFRFRKQEARHFRGSVRWEAAWTAATTVLFLALMLTGSRIWAGVHLEPAPAGALRVEVIAYQFAWGFRYPGPDGRFGRTDPSLVNDAALNPFGLDEKDPDARDDIVTTILRAPAGRAVQLTLRARDVIHSFFVPELRLKQDAVPGMAIPLHFVAGLTGSYEIPCSELCGLGHSTMVTRLEVLPPATFDAWLREQSR